MYIRGAPRQSFDETKIFNVVNNDDLTNAGRAPGGPTSSMGAKCSIGGGA